MKELICIGCPMGCHMSVEMKDNKVISVSGNTCKRGEIYAGKELTNPTRIVTSTVRVCDGELPVVSVKTKTDIPKEKIFQCINELADIIVEAPVKTGDVIVQNIAGTGISVVATKNISVNRELPIACGQ